MRNGEMRRVLRRLARLMIFIMVYPLAKRLQHKEIPVLVYHSVDDDTMCPFSVSTGKFLRQIRYLKDSGYQSISLHGLVAHVQGASQAVGQKSIVLTFDDGFKDFYTNVLPVLRRYGFSAVLPVVTDFCNNGRTDSYHKESPVPALSWDEIRYICGEGIEIASHSMSHRKLTSIPMEEADREIQKSKERIEEALNTKVDLFCYPHGACSDQAADFVKHHGYNVAMTTMPGLVRRGDDVYRLKRVPVEPEFSLMEFKAMLTRAVEWYCSLLWGRIGRACGFGERQIF